MATDAVRCDDDVWLDVARMDIEPLRAATARSTRTEEVPHAVEVVSGVPVYDGGAVDALAADPQASRALMAEWNRLLEHGAGVFVVRRAWSAAVIDRVNVPFERMLDSVPADTGDHFAVSGRNVRVWNAHEKLAVADPDAFIDYVAAPTLALAATAWLGPGYQVTAQLNLVRPGGRAQAPHRDYHLGFQSAERVVRWPASAHRASAALTLQGAVAHVAMPIESGPTQLLPHSQAWSHGYAVKGHPDIDLLFAEHRVQIALEPGDALFFNPALLHAAGDNDSRDVQRLANLLQIGSAFGRTMEIVDRPRLVRALYPTLLARRHERSLSGEALARVVAASAEGYPFPVNLEREPPRGGGPPASQQDLLRDALKAGTPVERFERTLATFEGLKRSC